MRPALSIHAAARRDAARPRIERLLESIGSDPAMAEGVLGDIAEERAERAARDGALRAGWWHVCETLRSAPWLVASAVQRAGWRGRAWLAATGAMVALLGTVVAMLVQSLAGDPARLDVEGDRGDGVVVNNVAAVQLATRVLDARGHVLPDSAVRYRWTGGAPIPVSASGVATCTQAGDATVRATLGQLATDLRLRCRPVSLLVGQHELAMIVGDRTAPIPFEALDASRHVVSPLRGVIAVADTSIVSMERAPDGQRLLRARSAGQTRVEVSVGDRSVTLFVDAYRRTSTLGALKPGDQRAVRVRLRAREWSEWTLTPSRELYFVRMLHHGDPEQAPIMAISGANCVPIGQHAFMCAAPRGARLSAYYPMWGDQSGERWGDLAVRRAAYP